MPVNLDQALGQALFLLNGTITERGTCWSAVPQGPTQADRARGTCDRIVFLRLTDTAARADYLLASAPRAGPRRPGGLSARRPHLPGPLTPRSLSGE